MVFSIFTKKENKVTPTDIILGHPQPLAPTTTTSFARRRLPPYPAVPRRDGIPLHII